MKRSHSNSLVLKMLLIILLLTTLLPYSSTSKVSKAQAAAPVWNLVGGAIKGISMINLRSRVYRQAELTHQERAAYYQSLVDRSQEQLAQRTLRDTYLRRIQGKTVIQNSQLYAYMRARKALEAEKDVVTQLIEAEKIQARRNFNRNLGTLLADAIIQSPGGKKLIADIRGTVDGLRQVTLAIKEAIEENRPIDSLVRQLSDRYQKIPIVQSAVHIIGSSVGHELDQRLGGLLGRLEDVADHLTAELDQATGMIENLDQYMINLQETERKPVSLIEVSPNLLGFYPLDRSNPAIDAAAHAYSKKVAEYGLLEGMDTSQEHVRDRIRQALLEYKINQLSGKSREMSHFVICKQTHVYEYRAAMNELEMTPEEPLDPDQVKYLVCHAKPTGDEIEKDPYGNPITPVIYAALIGPSKAEVDKAESESEKAVDDTQGKYHHRLSVSSDQINTIEQLFPNQVASRLKGDCPPLPADIEWWVEADICQWPVYHDVSSFDLTYTLQDKGANPQATVELHGDLNLQLLSNLGESGEGEMVASGEIENITFTDKSGGKYLLEGTIPVDIQTQGEYVIFETSNDFHINEAGGIITTVDAEVKIDTALRRFEIRYEDYPLDIPTGYGDGNQIEALTIDFAFIWADGQLK